jgi:argininosuccinate lyase
MAKLWAKNYELDSLVEEFTVGSDYLLDMKLVPADCVGSMAHAEMLAAIGILPRKEADALKAELLSIVRDHRAGSFAISRSDEDCHTAIENRLTSKLGEPGKKIHTGRSRNDQVVTALRLYTRSFLLSYIESVQGLVLSLLTFARAHEFVPMPGRTHMQIAMPSSVGLWAAAWAEELLDLLEPLRAVYRLIDRSPLGSAASYGVPLPLDRELTARLMGFSSVQRNVLAVQNSRGRAESLVLDALDQIGITLSKMAQDLILFSLPEFGYFGLPARLCTGSSIMPQKKNPDGLELLRAKSATLSAAALQVKSIVRSLPSGYNRDFQETKEPFLHGASTALASSRIMTLTIENLEVYEENLRKAFTPEIFATDAALERVARGMSFRDAYREVGLSLEELTSRDPDAALRSRTATGTTGNLGLDAAERTAAELAGWREGEAKRVDAALAALAGEPVALV